VVHGAAVLAILRAHVTTVEFDEVLHERQADAGSR
jgi:hypothetical protein